MMLTRALLLAMLVVPGGALAQSKPVQLIVPFAPGASADGIARAIAPELGTRIGRTVVIENKAGAGGTLGLIAVSKAPPDGDTLTLAATGALVINPHIPNATPIDPLRDVVAVAKLIEIPPAVCEKVAAQYESHDSGRGAADWPAYLRMLDRTDASYRT